MATMTYSVAPEDYRLGVPAIDADHRHLVDLSRAFLEAAASGAPAARLELLMATLIDATRNHFADEERLLDRAQYPQLASHRAEHTRLLAQAEVLRGRFGSLARKEDCSPVARDAADYMINWLLGHIRDGDAATSSCLRRLT